MNNKLGGFLILFVMTMMSGLFYWYYFIFSLINITIESNIDNYELSFESKNKSFDYTCEQKICIIEKISPFDYDIIGEREGYKNFEISWSPKKNNKLLNIVFEKDFQLEKIDIISQNEANKILEKKVEEIETMNIQQKIAELKIKQNLYLEKSGEESQYFFINSGEKLKLLEGQKELGTFEKYKKSEINLREVLGNKNYLFLELAEKKYFFSKLSGDLQEIIMDIPIKYIKSSEKNGEFIFVTYKGAFLYDLYENIFSYNSFFSDFVFFDDDAYVGVIDANETNKRIRFANQNNSGESFIVYYNPETKEQNILLTTDKKIERIYKSAGRVYFVDQNENNFLLTQLTEQYEIQ